MPKYKDLNNKIHFLESAEYEHLLPAGCIEITDAEWAAIQEANKPVITYKELRAREYPDYREYLDGIVKGNTEQVDKYIADCLAVKAKYPKE